MEAPGHDVPSVPSPKSGTAVVRERHLERCGPAVGSTGASDKAYYAHLLKELDTEDPETHVYICGM